MKAWMIEKPDGELDITSTQFDRSSCIMLHEHCHGEEWRKLYRQGYRCVRVKITKEGR